MSNQPTTGTSPLTGHGLPASPLTRGALEVQAGLNNGAHITPAPASPGRAAFTVTFPDMARAIAFATTIEILGWRCETRLARHIGDLTDPVTLTVTGPPADPAQPASDGGLHPRPAPDQNPDQRRTDLLACVATEALTEIRSMARQLLHTDLTTSQVGEIAPDLAERFDALDRHISSGNPLPAPWTSQRHSVLLDLPSTTIIQPVTGPPDTNEPRDQHTCQDDGAGDDGTGDDSAGRRYLVTVTETVTYRIRVTAGSTEDAEQDAEEQFSDAEDTNVYFFSVDEREFDAELDDDGACWALAPGQP